MLNHNKFLTASGRTEAIHSTGTRMWCFCITRDSSAEEQKELRQKNQRPRQAAILSPATRCIKRCKIPQKQKFYTFPAGRISVSVLAAMHMCITVLVTALTMRQQLFLLEVASCIEKAFALLFHSKHAAWPLHQTNLTEHARMERQKYRNKGILCYILPPLHPHLSE